MNRNAQKWFKIAIRFRPESEEAYLGLAISSLKLAEHSYCIDIVK